MKSWNFGQRFEQAVNYVQPAVDLASMGLSPAPLPKFTIKGMAYNHTQPGLLQYLLIASPWRLIGWRLACTLLLALHWI